MKLSTAIIAGMQTLRFNAADPDCDVFGAAASAVGIPRFGATSEEIMARQEAILGYWPWLERNILVQGEDYYRSLMMEIEYRFDQQVCGGNSSLSDLLSYIRSLEPECGECCSYGCTCERATPLFRELMEQQNRETPQAWGMRPPDRYYEDVNALIEEEERMHQRRDAVIDFPDQPTPPTTYPAPPDDGISGDQRGSIVADVYPVNVERRFPLGRERLEAASTTLNIGEVHDYQDDWCASTPVGRTERLAKWRSWERFGRVLGWSWLASLGLMLLVMAIGSFSDPPWLFWAFSVPGALLLCSSAVAPVWLLWPYLWALRSAGTWQELYNELGRDPFGLLTFDLLMTETRREFVVRLAALVIILFVIPACFIAACSIWR